MRVTVITVAGMKVAAMTAKEWAMYVHPSHSHSHYSPTHPLTYLPTCLLAYLPTYLLTIPTRSSTYLQSQEEDEISFEVKAQAAQCWVLLATLMPVELVLAHSRRRGVFSALTRLLYDSRYCDKHFFL